MQLFISTAGFLLVSGAFFSRLYGLDAWWLGTFDLAVAVGTGR